MLRLKGYHLINTTIHDWTILGPQFYIDNRKMVVVQCKCGQVECLRYENLNHKNRCYNCSIINKKLNAHLRKRFNHEDIIQLYKEGYTSIEISQKSGCAYRTVTNIISNFRGSGKRLQNEHPSWQGYGKISKTYYSNIVHGAKSRDIDFSIDIKYIWDLFLQQNQKCALTNIDLIFSNTRLYSNLTTASLDRIDNDKGYIKGNVQWVHKDINKLKMNMDEVKLQYYIQLIYNKHLEDNLNFIEYVI